MNTDKHGAYLQKRENMKNLITLQWIHIRINKHFTTLSTYVTTSTEILNTYLLLLPEYFVQNIRFKIYFSCTNEKYLISALLIWHHIFFTQYKRILLLRNTISIMQGKTYLFPLWETRICVIQIDVFPFQCVLKFFIYNAIL